MPRWVGWVTLTAGVLLFLTTRRERDLVPPWLPRLATAVAALGVATLAANEPGLGWSVAAIAFSLVAIILILWVMIDSTRRR